MSLKTGPTRSTETGASRRPDRDDPISCRRRRRGRSSARISHRSLGERRLARRLSIGDIRGTPGVRSATALVGHRLWRQPKPAPRAGSSPRGRPQALPVRAGRHRLPPRVAPRCGAACPGSSRLCTSVSRAVVARSTRSPTRPSVVVEGCTRWRAACREWPCPGYVDTDYDVGAAPRLRTRCSPDGMASSRLAVQSPRIGPSSPTHHGRSVVCSRPRYTAQGGGFPNRTRVIMRTGPVAKE